MDQECKNFIIVDASSLLYRAFYALPPLTNKEGQPTGAVYGFLLTLFKAIKDLKTDYIAACFDTPKPTFRHEKFKEYKAQRPPMPRDIAAQIPLLKEILESLGIPIFEKEGFEADDIIATVAAKMPADFCSYILSGDLDNLQLVDEKTKVYTLGKGVRDSVTYDEKKVIERFGVKPSQMNDFKALAGDASDNVPGVPGVGKTTAADLIQRFGGLENLYSEIATDTAVLKPKVKKALKENKEKTFLSLHLVQTKKNVEIDFEAGECRFGGFDKEKAARVFSEAGFNSLIEKLSTVASN